MLSALWSTVGDARLSDVAFGTGSAKNANGTILSTTTSGILAFQRQGHAIQNHAKHVSFLFAPKSSITKDHDDSASSSSSSSDSSKARHRSILPRSILGPALVPAAHSLFGVPATVLGCIPFFWVDPNHRFPWDDAENLPFMNNLCKSYHWKYVWSNYSMAFISSIQFLLGEFVPGFLGGMMAGMGLYAVTPEGLSQGGSFLSSVVVVSFVQGLVQFLTFAEVFMLKKAQSFVLLPLLKGVFLLQPIASMGIVYFGYQLLKNVRQQLFSGFSGQPTEPPQQASSIAPIQSFIAFTGRGFHLGEGSDSEELLIEESSMPTMRSSSPDATSPRRSNRSQQSVSGVQSIDRLEGPPNMIRYSPNGRRIMPRNQVVPSLLPGERMPQSPPSPNRDSVASSSSPVIGTSTVLVAGGTSPGGESDGVLIGQPSAALTTQNAAVTTGAVVGNMLPAETNGLDYRSFFRFVGDTVEIAKLGSKPTSEDGRGKPNSEDGKSDGKSEESKAFGGNPRLKSILSSPSPNASATSKGTTPRVSFREKVAGVEILSPVSPAASDASSIKEARGFRHGGARSRSCSPAVPFSGTGQRLSEE